MIIARPVLAELPVGVLTVAGVDPFDCRFVPTVELAEAMIATRYAAPIVVAEAPLEDVVGVARRCSRAVAVPFAVPFTVGEAGAGTTASAVVDATTTVERALAEDAVGASLSVEAMMVVFWPDDAFVTTRVVLLSSVSIATAD